MPPKMYFVIPCYNEESVLPVTAPIFLQKTEELIKSGKVSNDSAVLFIDDGSKDKTWDFICSLAQNNPHAKGIALSRNRGHQNALLAGLFEVKDGCDFAISIDCDGQDDINAADKMVDEYLKGADVVYGVRNRRDTDTAFKRITARGFYRFMNLLGTDIIYDHADYRLMSSRAIRALAQFKEVNIFLRGMVTMVGFKSTCVYYERRERMAGKGHYPLKKMLSLAFDGITSLSIRPIRLITVFGFAVAIISLIGIIWSVVTAFAGHTVAGWASTVSIICFLGGIQLLSLGVIGEYIGKIYLETKARPRFIISERTDGQSEEN